ncbi:hypothetical protein POTOM_031887 [Populus tomentosa]|uniref:Uncharacterized protein n=1 Tax=Populus tomentosa TaxID=118781 RepID=A0A8X8CSZ6_POPTO|nr:hypothetical protein POTOM_031887 [Populus tomentosa]
MYPSSEAPSVMVLDRNTTRGLGDEQGSKEYTFLKRDDEIKKSKGERDEACCRERERERERIEHTFRERKKTNRWKRTGRVENVTSLTFAQVFIEASCDSLRHPLHWQSERGDVVVITLKDGTKVDPRSVPQLREIAKYCLSAAEKPVDLTPGSGPTGY